MQLRLRRLQLDPDVTIGQLLIDGEPYCWICEDTVRPEGVKVKGDTAIPYGRYRVDYTFSNRFQRMMPILLDVPMFEGIRIHTGNTSADTEGCLLPGLTRLEKGVAKSRIACGPLYDQIAASIAAGEEVWITIEPPAQAAE